jgi:hypothetical protein
MIDYDAIKYEIELSSCNIHQAHPEIIINETRDNISLACCCEDFQKICIDEIKGLLADQARNEIMSAWNSGFKG